MPRNDSLAVIACYNSREATRHLLARVPRQSDFDVLVVDDGSRDGTRDVVAGSGLPTLLKDENGGLGAAIRDGIRHARRAGYAFMAVLAGNGKDDPGEVDGLLAPLRAGECDYVQGSRFLRGGSSPNLPLARHVLVRAHARLVRLLTGFPATDAANGFRAYRLALLADPRIDLDRSALDGYGLEAYLHARALRLGYRMKEVPVTKTYPPAGSGQRRSHVRPFVDWWPILRPLLIEGLRRPARPSTD